MAIVQSLCNSFRAELLLAVHDFRPSAQSGASVFKLALYTSAASLDAATTAYTTAGEVTGVGYVAGGLPLTNLGATAISTGSNSGVGLSDFADLVFPNATFTARGALIYNSTPKALSNTGATLVNPAVMVLDFGANRSATGQNFTITFPTADINNAIVRIS